MPTVAFRFVHPSSGKSTGHVGIATARNAYDLFWMINEFDDASACEIATVSEMALCVCPATGKIQHSDALHPATLPNLKWKKPKWPDDVTRKMF
jgi:hypothetical protein